MPEGLPKGLRPVGEKRELEEYPVKLERMDGELVRRNDDFPEIASLSNEQMLDFAHFAVDPNHPGGVWVDHRPGHNRSFVWSDSNIVDGKGEDLGKLNIKGTGFVSLGGIGGVAESFKGRHILPEFSRRTLRPKKPGTYAHNAFNKGMYGLMSLEDAKVDFDNGERLAEMGVRGSRGIAIIKLHTIYYPGQGIVRVEELKRRGIIPNDFEPVVYVRATGSDHRVRDYEDPELFSRSDRSWLKKQKMSAIASAIERVGKEIGNEGLTTEEYLRWFAETLGKQVGTLHRNGYIHGGLFKRPSGYVHPVDITLDCRILDLDGVETLADVEAKLVNVGMDVSKAKGVFNAESRSDVESARKSLVALLASCRDVSSGLDKGDLPPGTKSGGDAFTQELMTLFDKAYADQNKQPS